MDAEFCVGTGRFSMAGLMGRRCRWSLLSRVLARVPAQFQIADGSLANTSQAVNALQFAFSLHAGKVFHTLSSG
jgi:hypothetical protein